MGKLLNPAMYRLSAEQEKWLRARAEKEGHGNKSLTLRLLIDRVMREHARRQKPAA